MNAKNAKPFSENIHFLFRNIAYGDFFIKNRNYYCSKMLENTTKICNTPNNCPLEIIPKMKY